MTCPICIPVDTVSPLGDHIRTNCRECGETMTAPGVNLDGFEDDAHQARLDAAVAEAAADPSTRAHWPHGESGCDATCPAFPPADAVIQAVLDRAFEEDILAEPQTFDPESGVTAARIEERDGELVLIQTVAAGDLAPEFPGDPNEDEDSDGFKRYL